MPPNGGQSNIDDVCTPPFCGNADTPQTQSHHRDARIPFQMSLHLHPTWYHFSCLHVWHHLTRYMLAPDSQAVRIMIEYYKHDRSTCDQMGCPLGEEVGRREGLGYCLSSRICSFASVQGTPMCVHQHFALLPIGVLSGSSYQYPHSLMCKCSRGRTHHVSEYILSSHDYKCMYYIHLYPNLQVSEISFTVDHLSSEVSKFWNCEWSTSDYNRCNMLVCNMLVFTWCHEHESDIHCRARPSAIPLLVKSHPVEVHNQCTEMCTKLHNDIRWFQICLA